MSSSDMTPLTVDSTYNSTAETPASESVTSLTTESPSTVFTVVTTAVPETTDSAVIAVVIVVVLLTLAVLGFLLYRYLCHNKGDYRTTGELAPGEDLDEDTSTQAAGEKKEYFI